MTRVKKHDRAREKAQLSRNKRVCRLLGARMLEQAHKSLQFSTRVTHTPAGHLTPEISSQVSVLRVQRVHPAIQGPLKPRLVS